MELKAIDFERILDAELIGKDVGYSHYNFSTAVLKLIRLVAKEEDNINENDFSYKTQSGTNNAVYLTYKGISIGEVSFKKQKGAYKYGSYEWTFKKCYVNFWNDSLYSAFKGMNFQQMLDKVDADIVSAQDEEARRLAKAKEIFQLIKKELNVDNYGARNFIEFMNKKKYSLDE